MSHVWVFTVGAAVATLLFVSCGGATTVKPKGSDVEAYSDADMVLNDEEIDDEHTADEMGGDGEGHDEQVSDYDTADSLPPDQDVTPPTCGNGEVDAGEVCDKSTGILANCVDINSEWYQGGKAYCQDDCLGWDTSTCEEVPHTCGNNIREGIEACDGDAMACAELDPEKYQSGTAFCNESCTGYVTDDCVEIEPSECGNGIREGLEVCDGEIATCVDIDPIAYSGGKAYCKNDCTGWDTSTCTERPTECESTLSIASKDPYDFAKAMGLCMGVPTAEMLLPSGAVGANMAGYALLPALGNVITPRQGDKMLALSSGQALNPPTNTNFDHQTSSVAPQDWYTANGGKYPNSPACGTEGTTGSTYDGVMARFEIDVPPTARSFSFDVYFLSTEYPDYVCSQYNDLFVVLLDSSFTTTNEQFKNPADKNLAVFEGNAVGVNLAPAGLFTQCTNTSGPGWAVTSCEGTEELAGTGFEGHGGTGWLTIRGNVVPGETITLRLALWDMGDHILDSMVLLDNFRWGTTTVTPGIVTATP